MIIIFVSSNLQTIFYCGQLAIFLLYDKHSN